MPGRRGGRRRGGCGRQSARCAATTSPPTHEVVAADAGCSPRTCAWTTSSRRGGRRPRPACLRRRCGWCSCCSTRRGRRRARPPCSSRCRAPTGRCTASRSVGRSTASQRVRSSVAVHGEPRQRVGRRSPTPDLHATLGATLVHRRPRCRATLAPDATQWRIDRAAAPHRRTVGSRTVGLRAARTGVVSAPPMSSGRRCTLDSPPPRRPPSVTAARSSLAASTPARHCRLLGVAERPTAVQRLLPIGTRRAPSRAPTTLSGVGSRRRLRSPPSRIRPRLQARSARRRTSTRSPTPGVADEAIRTPVPDRPAGEGRRIRRRTPRRSGCVSVPLDGHVGDDVGDVDRLARRRRRVGRSSRPGAVGARRPDSGPAGRSRRHPRLRRSPAR